MSAQNVTFGKLVRKVPQVLANQRISVVYSMSFCSSSFFLFGCEILGYGHYFHERKEKNKYMYLVSLSNLMALVCQRILLN